MFHRLRKEKKPYWFELNLWICDAFDLEDPLTLADLVRGIGNQFCNPSIRSS